MRQLFRFVLLSALVCASSLVSVPAHAQAKVAAVQATLPIPGTCVNGTLPHGALSLICVPIEGWNGDLVVFAHGYVAYNQPLDFYNLDINGIYIPTLVQQLGFAFATTSYRQNGLAVLQGVDDIQELVAAFRTRAGGTLGHTYIVGGSEGGIITTLLVERKPELFSGGLAMCGPIGSFQKQIDYDGDFRVLFDYFFPGILPGSAIRIPQYVIDHWDDTYLPAITAAVNANPDAAAQLIATANAAIDPQQLQTTTLATITGVLWYSVFATNDAAAKLGGNPYGNRERWYSGSKNDVLLNAKVERYTEAPVPRLAVIPYETSGNITIPLVTMHTRGDPIIPFWHERLYAEKVHLSGDGSKLQIPINAYGHCAFTTNQLLAAFGLLLQRVTNTPLAELVQNDGLVEHVTQ